jgi:hypothetical protein
LEVDAMSAQIITTDADPRSRVEALADLIPNELWGIPEEEIRRLQLESLKMRFADLLPRVPMLRKLATEQGIETIRTVDDAAPLLFRHNVYKSYPLSFLEKGEFQKLTRWLDGLTAFDLSRLDASQCGGIDDWIDLFDRETEIRMIHSSGTSGKLSFLPRSEGEFVKLHLKVLSHIYEGFGEEGDNVIKGMDELPIINPTYASGSLMAQRQLEHVAKFWHRGSGVPIVSLNPSRISADALSLAGRVQAAEARGELGQLKLSAKLLARREEFVRQAKETPARMEAFLDEIAKLKGCKVLMYGVLGPYYDLMLAGRKRGMNRLFDSGSLILMGGGTKGRDMAAGWENDLFEFLGVPESSVRQGYGMSEIIGGGVRRCRGGHFHLQPWIILYQLEPTTGEILPRKGVVTGRLGVFDLLASTHWGGFLSGDEATITWDQPCACGRNGPYLDATIRRYSESEGGDDKVTCAGAPAAQDRAVQFLLDSAG